MVRRIPRSQRVERLYVAEQHIVNEMRVLRSSMSSGMPSLEDVARVKGAISKYEQELRAFKRWRGY